MITTCKTIDEMADIYPDLFTSLTSKERFIFCELTKQKPVSYGDLQKYFPDATSNVVHVHIKNLRRKVPRTLATIHTVRGYGFRLTAK